MIHLVLGGARSGKSSFSERWVKSRTGASRSGDSRTGVSRSAGSLHYVATAIAFDKEMESRIAMHKDQRGDGWILHECPEQLPELLARFQEGDVVLVDCLTLWLNNVIFAQGEQADAGTISGRVNELVEALKASAADITLVSNEVGLGVVPLGEVSRLFVDHAGWMNQKIAAVAERVTFVAAGLPMTLKGNGCESA